MIRILHEKAAAGAKRADIAEAAGVSLTVLSKWISTDQQPEAAFAYREGRKVMADELAESIMEEARAPLHENPKLAHAEVARRRLVVETIKWVTSKLLPKTYGDNLQVEHNHSGTVEVSPLAQLRQLESRLPPTPTPRVLEAEILPSDVGEADCF